MSDLDRAIAIIEDSRQTHVRWAEWRRKGNGVEADHELIGDLKWHENAIRDYDHVLNVLRAGRSSDPEPAPDFSDATPGPWVVQVPGDNDPGAGTVFIDTHAYSDGPEPIVAPTYPLSEADASLIVYAVNRLRGAVPALQATPEHDINCGIDPLHLGEDIGCTCWVGIEQIACLSRPSDERVPEDQP